MGYCHSKKGAINLTASIIIVVVMLVVLIFAFALPGAALGLIREPETVMGTNIRGGSVQCTTWEDVGFEIQSRIQEAADNAGIHPALLATIYWKENGDSWKPVNSVFECDSGGCGPFQILKNPEIGHTEEVLQDWSQAVVIAANILRNSANALKVDPTSEDGLAIQAIALAYNRGASVATAWRDAGYPELTAALIFEYQKHYSVYTEGIPEGQPGDYYERRVSGKGKDVTQWWYAEVGDNYVKRSLTMFNNLAKGCEKYSAYIGDYGSWAGIPFVLPFNKGTFTSPFGWRIHPIFKTRKMHEGIDVSMPQGSPLYAVFDGTVINTGEQRGYGQIIEIRSTYNEKYTAFYAHLMDGGAVVSVGDHVVVGQLIGYSGSTGVSTGPHLHFEIRVDGNKIDPCIPIKYSGINYSCHKVEI